VILQRNNNFNSKPPSLKDPFGGKMVVVYFSGNNPYKFQFVDNHQDKFISDAIITIENH